MQRSPMDDTTVALHHERLASREEQQRQRNAPLPAPPAANRRLNVTTKTMSPTYHAKQPYGIDTEKVAPKRPPLHHRPRQDARHVNVPAPTSSHVYSTALYGASLDPADPLPPRQQLRQRAEVVPWMPLIESGRYLAVPSQMMKSTPNKPRDEKTVQAGAGVWPEDIPTENAASLDYATVRRPTVDRDVVTAIPVTPEDAPQLLAPPPEFASRIDATPESWDRVVTMSGAEAPRMPAPFNNTHLVEKDVSKPFDDRYVTSAGATEATPGTGPTPVVPPHLQAPSKIVAPTTTVERAPALAPDTVPLDLVRYDGHTTMPLPSSASTREPRDVILTDTTVPDSLPDEILSLGTFTSTYAEEKGGSTMKSVLFADTIVAEDEEFPFERDFSMTTSFMAEHEKRNAHAAPPRQPPQEGTFSDREPTLQQEFRVNLDAPLIVGWGEE